MTIMLKSVNVPDRQRPQLGKVPPKMHRWSAERFFFGLRVSAGSGSGGVVGRSAIHQSFDDRLNGGRT